MEGHDEQTHYVKRVRAAQREDDRGRLLPGERAGRRDAATGCPTTRQPAGRAASGPARLHGVLVGPGLPGPVGGVGPRELERPAPLPQLRRLPRGRLHPGHRRGLRRGARPRRRRARPRLQAPDARQHGRGDRPLRGRARRPTPSSRKTSRPPLRRSARPRRRPPARAARRRSRGRSSPASAAFASRHVRRAPARAPRPARPSPRSGRRSAPPAPASAPRSSSASPGSRSRARISGRVTVPSSRSVPRGLPVRSGGPGHVEHVVEDLERQADALAEAPSASAIAGPAAEQGAQPARGREQARRLEPAALEVALRRHVGAPGVGALHQLAARERARGLRQRAHRLRGCRSTRARRRRARRAGRRWRWPPAGRPRRRPWGARGAAARGRARRRARASPCAAAPRPRRAATSRSSAVAVRAQEDQHRAQPLAARRRASPSRAGRARRRGPRRPRRAAPRCASSSRASSGPPAASTAPSCACAVFMMPSARGHGCPRGSR